ncbi:MAG: hypothetical protein UV58_C0017G0003 [Candidatus Wolfebacteria bacterium GW2011_GWC1_43_10]|uniref:Uncharacterized protein n=1 Tax=Candidatus Wolfebacteria bacterium GW2011_GWC1_43_10 TaxID=1619011 RepID=A0A0G1F4B4_9BACT|nr:MAG: hypothetical protein UV58_C0017G0003 [Candidatus Wolfebacteria bacterium GW2011_GWC1_43_10]KKT22941.1 MAG: hypothetical protein UW08_C0002G0070 [Parcubacteria group bacterium GW2011_GWB1_43_8b]
MLEAYTEKAAAERSGRVTAIKVTIAAAVIISIVAYIFL